MSDAIEETKLKSKRYLSIVWKLMIPLMVAFGIMLLYMYNLIDEFMEGTATNIFKTEIRVVLTDMNKCLDVDAMRDFQSDLVQDEDFDVVQACFEQAIEAHDRTIIATYFEDQNGDLLIGVQYDLIYQDSFEPGTKIDDDFILALLAEDEADIELIQEYLETGLKEDVFQDQYFEYIPEDLDEATQIFYTGYFPFLETTERDGLIVQIEAGDIVQKINDFQLNIFLGAFGGLITIAVILYVVASRNTASIRKLSAAAEMVGSGDYEDTDLSEGNWFDDEVSTLEKIFDDMVQKVYEREKALVEKVTELKIFIDEGRKKEDLKEIMSSDMYKDMQSRAKEMREKIRGKRK